MNFIQFAGFIALLLFMVNSIKETKRRRENPEEFEEEELKQAERLKAFLRDVNHDMQEMPAVPPRKQVKAITKPIQNPVTITQQKSFTQQKNINAPPRPIKSGHSEHIHTLYEDAYATGEQDPYAASKIDAYAFVQKRKSRASSLIGRLQSPKDMVLWHEIIGPPLALKDERHPGNSPH